MLSSSRRAPLFQAIAECTYDWESWIEPSGRLGWVNAAVERFTGYSVEECMVLDGYPLALVHEEDRARMEAVLRSAAAGSVGNDVEFRVVRKDGEVRWGSVSWQPLVDEEGSPLGFRASVRDIGERKELEAQLRASRERAEAADRAKTELLANVSHELRAPAHCVAGYAELLLEAGLEGEHAKRAEVIRSQAALLLRQVEDLLDMASLESGGVSIERRALTPEALLRNAVDPFAEAAARKGIALEASRDEALPARFLGDELRLSQVLRNLVENAVEHTVRGHVRVAIERESMAGDREGLAMSVRDTGVGIPAELLAEVRRPFVRGGARARRGAGLGLAIADRLARQMGGTLAIESAVGRGTTVRVSLPIEACEPDGPRASRAEDDLVLAARLPPLEILVVDDTPASRELLAEQLARLGYAPRIATSGREALERAAEAPPDLVLLDMQMPDLDGVEVAVRLAKSPRAPRVVGVSASTFARDRIHPREVRLDAFLLRPVGRERLAALLSDLFAERASEHAVPLIDEEVVADLREARDASGRSMLERYSRRAFEELPAMFAEARGALGAGQPEGAVRALHAAAGILASIGARRAAEASCALERAIAERAPRDHVAELDAIERMVRETAAAIGR